MTAVSITPLTPLEVASGLIFGFTPPETLPSPDEAGTPIEALERAILPALLRPPCLVSFSGGRDSSTVLAVAVNLARREGLELPVPATNRFPRAEGSDESAWQERVIVHLGLTEWLRLEFTDELDTVGPVAMRVLRKHGLVTPFNAHFHVPLFEEALGGSVITGIGGDEALGVQRWARAANVLAGKVRPRPRDVLTLGLAAAPSPVRRAVLARRDTPILLPWLRPNVQQEVWSRWVATVASQPLRWQGRFAWYRRLRYIRLGLESLGGLAADFRVEAHHPFVDAGFSASVAGLPREDRFLGRTAAMRELFGHLLPADVAARRSKSQYDFAFWAAHSRALVQAWDGNSVDTELVDPEILRQEWSQPSPDARTYPLLQTVALARESAVGEPPQAVGSFA
ncbi:MAG TPA: asparagine synthase-related protein [Gaiellaceae bacterium]